VRTLILFEELDEVFELTFLENYPVIRDKKVVYKGLVVDNGRFGMIDRGEFKELKQTKEYIKVTKKLKEQAELTQKWLEVTTETGQTLLFPPNIT